MTPLLELLAFIGMFCGALCLAGLIGLVWEKRWVIAEHITCWLMPKLEEQPTDPPWVEWSEVWPEKGGWEDYT
jgi:hypothetical protein